LFRSGLGRKYGWIEHPCVIIKEIVFELSVEQTFAAGHALRNYKGKCENVHGHNYRVRVVVQGPELDYRGLLVDFGDIKKVMKEVIERLDHQFINDIPPFTELNPSAENLALYFHQEVSKGLTTVASVPVQVTEVNIWETDIQNATYRP
jgi:6-pyruvoyltetrahydropterin/6-carboxytetrahydropterin synthase